MSRGKRGRQRQKPKTSATTPRSVRSRPSPNAPYDVVYFVRHIEDDPQQSSPGREFLADCPPAIRARFQAVIAAVAAAPPHRFSGGGYWEAMHGTMAGYYEIRIDGQRRIHYRLFCRLDTSAIGRKPLLVIICGASKRFRTTFSDRDYAKVRAYGTEYLARNPRSIS
jgi:Txe/YoeB family toxin of Txe-Axe toxin-antitoxin module